MLFLMFVLVIISWPWWLVETSLHKIIMDQQWGCRTVGPTSKIPPKIKKKLVELTDHTYVINNLTSFWIWNAYNHRKRKLCQSDENCLIKTREITTSELIFGWFYPFWTNVRRPPVTKALPAPQPALTRPTSRPSPGSSQPLKAGGLVCLLNFANVTQQPLEEGC